MENIDNPTTVIEHPLPRAHMLTDKALFFLDKTSKWSKFIAVIGFIGCGFMFLTAIILLVSATFVTESAKSLPSMIGALVYIGIGAVSIFPNLYLYRFSDKIFYAIRDRDNELLEISFENLWRYFKFTSILYIVGIGVGLLALVIGFIIMLVTGSQLLKGY